MVKFFKFKILFKYLFIFVLVNVVFTAYASTNGTIDAVDHSVLLCVDDTCTTTSQINFGYFLNSPSSNVIVTDSHLEGFIWGESFGWVVLNCLNTTSGCSSTNGNFGVFNDGDGNLSGYAWGENTGWINFGPFLNNSATSVNIDNSGEFNGYAWAQNYGWIKFDCSVLDACVKTDWRADDGGGNSGGGGGSIEPPPPGDPIITPDPIVTPDPIITPDPDVDDDNEGEGDEDSQDDENNADDNDDSVEQDPNGNGNGNGNGDGQNSGDENSVMIIIQEQVEQALTQVNEVVSKTIKTLKIEAVKITEIIQTPGGEISSQIISTTGVISGASISIATALFANPLSFSELFLIPFRLWGLILIAFGFKKRNVPWGTVYDSVTKQPLDPAYVVLQDLNRNEVATSITDLDGRYGFLVPPGQYRMIANKTNYEFPSKKLFGKLNDELYQELYFDEIIDVPEGGVISKNIPLDPKKFDWNEFAKKDRNLMKFFKRRDIWIARISNFLFIAGFVVTLVAVIVSPVSYNIAIFVVYLILFILKRTILKPRAFGYIRQIQTKNPLSFAIIRVFFADGENEVIHKITDKTGKYYCLVPNGQYYVKIENKNIDESYSLVHTSEPIDVKAGYINKKFEV